MGMKGRRFQNVGEMFTTDKYLKANPTWHAEDSPWKAECVVNMLDTAGLRPSSVCEVGCGAGRVLQELASAMPYCSFDGFEVSRDAFEMAASLCLDRVSVHYGSVADCDRHYDVMLALDVVEHVPDFLGFLVDLRSRSEFQIFHIPLDMTVLSALRPHRILESRISVGHLHYFCRETAIAALEESGYEVLRYRLTSGALDNPSAILTAFTRVANVARRLLPRHLGARVVGGFSLLALTRSRSVNSAAARGAKPRGDS